MIHQTEANSNHLQTVYRVKLKRIGKGYSAERLSFMIGADHDYIEKVEALLLPVYPPAELERIACVLEETNHNNSYAPVNEETILKIMLDRCSLNNKVGHSYSMIVENEEEGELFMLMEELFGDFDDEADSTENLEIAVGFIGLLVHSGYFFTFKSPAEILHSINHLLTVPLDAFYIELALAQYCKETEGLLRKCESVTDGIRYEER